MTTIDSFSGNYWFLSNFYPSRIVIDLKVYSTVEHAYQASKTRVEYQQEMIRTALTPGKAKRLGNSVILRKDWESVKQSIMLRLIRLKFAPKSILADQLDATRSATLIEGNTWGDVYWGQVDGKGHNYLGKILMQVRAENRK